MEHHDYIIVGTGVCGIFQLVRLLEMGADAIALDANAGPGGTWFNNRYPGCRFDSESHTYGYSFSKELLQEWDWKEFFSPQPDNLRYLEHVVEKFRLRPHMRFGAKVASAIYDDATSLWNLTLDDGRRLSCRMFVTALGLLSARTLPKYPGMDSFRGRSFHTFDWPHEGVDLAGKKVAVIGTGATGVQVISAIAGTVGELVVFQRRPNWCAPLHNRPITRQEMDDIKASYDEIFARCDRTPGGFIHGPDRRRFAEVPREERLAFWEKIYSTPGFEVLVGNFREVLMDEEANAEYSAFIADKIRQRVFDPVTAEKLIPKDHGFGIQRVPLETRYYEQYNRPNVHLIDIEETPIQEITPEGIRTSDRSFDFDVIVYATGFDAITGSFDKIDIRGRDGLRLRDHWAEDPRTYLGVQVAGFPNMVMLAGPQAASSSTNFPRAIEVCVEWATRLFRHMEANGIHTVECTAEAEEEWCEHVRELYSMVLLRNAKSWFTGYNENVEGRNRTRNLIYNGGAPRYRKQMLEVESTGYPGFELS